jgi:Tfp pilus assembly protein PilF
VEYRVHAFAEAERHYRSAQASLDAAPPASAPDRARILNELAAVLIAQGDYAEAGEVLLAAETAAGRTDVVAGQIANNLAALAALRGDRAQAASLYEAALGVVDRSQAPSRSDRRIIEQNLAALGQQQ